MRTLVRTVILGAVATGFAVMFSTAASADVVEPKSAYQPASVGLLEQEAAKAAAAEPDPAEVADAEAQAKQDKANAKAEAAATEEKKAKPDEIVAATPAPEHVVRQAPAHLVRPPSPVAMDEPTSVVERVFHPLRAGLQKLGASLARVVSACEVGLSTGSGGPVSVLAVLGMAVPFVRRRVVGTRWATDEAMPRFLYAWELTPPG